MASLDPLARRDFLRALAEIGEEGHVTVLLSSHIIADLDGSATTSSSCRRRRCSSSARSPIARTHKRLTASHREPGAIAGVAAIIEEYATPRGAQLVVRTDGPLTDPAWDVSDVGLEEIVLAYLGHSSDGTSGRAVDLARMEVSQ